MKDLLGNQVPETDVKDYIRAVLSPVAKVYNVVTGAFKVKSGGTTRWITTFPKGTPDLMGFRYSDHKIFFIEVKRERGVLSPEQKEFRLWALAEGLIYGVARSPEDAQLILNEKWNNDWDLIPVSKREA